MSSHESPQFLSNPPPSKRPRLDVADPSEPLSKVVQAPVSKASVAKRSRKLENNSKKKKKAPPPAPGSVEDVNLRDIYSVLGPQAVKEVVAAGMEYEAPIDLRTEIELTVQDICSHGLSFVPMYRRPR